MSTFYFWDLLTDSFSQVKSLFIISVIIVIIFLQLGLYLCSVVSPEKDRKERLNVFPDKLEMSDWRNAARLVSDVTRDFCWTSLVGWQQFFFPQPSARH